MLGISSNSCPRTAFLASERIQGSSPQSASMEVPPRKADVARHCPAMVANQVGFVVSLKVVRDVMRLHVALPPAEARLEAIHDHPMVFRLWSAHVVKQRELALCKLVQIPSKNVQQSCPRRARHSARWQRHDCVAANPTVCVAKGAAPRPDLNCLRVIARHAILMKQHGVHIVIHSTVGCLQLLYIEEAFV